MSLNNTTPVTTKIYRGEPLRDQLLTQVAREVAGMDVRLCVVQVGDDASSNAYIRRKLAACEDVGIDGGVVRLDAAQGEAALHETVRHLGEDANVHAIIVQTPLPAGWKVQAALDLVPAVKDIDGLSTASIALRREGDARALLPATPLGILRLMEQMGVSVACTKVAVVGKGLVVGAPLREMLVVAGAEVVGIEKGTVAPEALSKACDVVVTATGVADLITEAWVKPGAVVIDAGTTELTSGQTLQGDVSRARVEGTAGILTPVPGGVGPVTVASLLTNIADAACLQLGRPRVRWVIDGASGA